MASSHSKYRKKLLRKLIRFVLPDATPAKNEPYPKPVTQYRMRSAPDGDTQ